ncbi:SDR family NAD(P)-dependent oxidoreductase [Conexibacter sp. JD483]|uniref:SDR family NAD(P)-dependent oxidoreductase n=1 Tax=unclassified Conexibacter TaxID=2627773 RepID=UPI0027192EA2|nr:MULTISPECIES: SDR family NAD(P)-dependent oxidoreductase [unclassified Conexibacter]MDO8188457.1 SDR family NAD(P)-dependent oxidoreductase [Conexibacter sp. CPCC 205706]MDO8199182.1 SDR family NAD(P)-dependent oxidoreductase [Conexibacter sp. CPCC 205762]MDR9371927.1 SDR family NAD(P)-dependent oxidoreductase [Conexibacter sp. JD483]
MTTKTIVITGASDGIGAAAARRLHHDGHRVVIVGRSPQKTDAVARELGADRFVADFTRLDEVRTLAAELDAACPRIDVLANNAGGVFGDRRKTADGFEQTFQINHLAPFLLTRLLLGKLIASDASVLQTSSVAARIAARRLDLDDLDHDRSYSPIRAYGAAKLENILFTRELHRRHHADGISAVAFHPGNVASSFGSGTTSRVMRFFTHNPLARMALITPEKGADQLVWLAAGSAGADWQPGLYYEKRKPAKRVNRQAYDAELATALWERSEQLLAR